MHCGYSSGNVKRISWHCHGSVVTFRSLHSFAPWRCHSRNSRFMMSIHHRLGPCEGKGCVTVSDSVICAAIVHLTFTQTAKSSYGSISDLFAKNWNRSKLLSCIQKLVLTHTLTEKVLSQFSFHRIHNKTQPFVPQNKWNAYFFTALWTD